DGAWKFVRYLARPDVQAEWYQIAAALPSVEAAWDEDALKGDPQLAAFGDQLNDAKSPPPIATWAQISAAFDGEMEKLCKTGMTPEEAAQAIQKKAMSIGTEA
ncbi:MAG: ABC transporter substrate-binding protein, partial [Micromonosporaceae bacterium]